MRKTATFKERRCPECGAEFIPNGPTQVYCKECSVERDKQRKKAWYKKKHPDSLPKKKSEEVCCVCGEAFSCHFGGLPYCNKHYQMMRKYGRPQADARNPTCTYEVIGETTEFRTAKGEVFWIDTDDLDAVRPHSWCINKGGYVVSRINGKIVRLQRLLVECDSCMVVDHIDGNPLNNKRKNLRVCTSAENSRNVKIKKSNKSGFTGVRKLESGMYNARIMLNRKGIHIGNFKTIEKAVEARKEAEKKLFGEYAASNSRTEQKSDMDNQRNDG